MRNKRLFLHNDYVINQLLLLIKKDKNFNQAAILMKEHHLSLEGLTNRTFKLTQIELAKLADKLIESA